ncbi:hypothetical protein ACIPY0_20355 [Paenarthrobacter nicotinovorans]|uniref:hypothetical protein n=1 Tax=Paenarthrobacter nicotinovorans TaxID=29320 RepID=UPI0038304220
MSNERDELAMILANAQRTRNGSTRLSSADQVSRLALDDADAMLAAGYRKRRTVTTVEELDALVVGTIILDSDPDALLKEDDGWRSLLVPDVILKSFTIGLPATVLYEPAS